MAGVWLTNGDNNIFTQIGLIVLVGLSAKNAILIVEFARELEFAGRTPRQAAIEASRLRLRPILMTSLAFIMGVLPLVTSTGAGAEMRHAMGVAVFAGMIGVTAFGIFLTPVFYVLLRQLTGNRPLKQHGETPHAALAQATAPPAGNEPRTGRVSHGQQSPDRDHLLPALRVGLAGRVDGAGAVDDVCRGDRVGGPDAGCDGGVFEVRVDGETVWSRKEQGRFPTSRSCKQLVRDRIAPKRSPGHSERT